MNTVNALIALAKSRPGKIVDGSSGNATSPQLCAELFSGPRSSSVGYEIYQRH